MTKSKYHVQRHQTRKGWCVAIYKFVWTGEIMVGQVVRKRYVKDEVSAMRVTKKWREELGYVVVGEAKPSE